MKQKLICVLIMAAFVAMAMNVIADEGHAFESGSIEPGGTFEHMFNDLGEWAFYNGEQPEVAGDVHVVDNSSASNGTVSIGIHDNESHPNHVEIRPGTKILWTNEGGLVASIIEGVSPVDAGGDHDEDGDDHSNLVAEWDSSHIGNNESWSRTFVESGYFDYYCHPHPEMRASITIDNSSEALNGSVAVTISEYAFHPKDIVIKPGTEVTWTNLDEAGHTATEGIPEKGKILEENVLLSVPNIVFLAIFIGLVTITIATVIGASLKSRKR